MGRYATTQQHHAPEHWNHFSAGQEGINAMSHCSYCQHQCIPADSPSLTVDTLPAASPRGEREYLVKWVGRSHMHNEWVRETLLARFAKRKLVNFQRRHHNANSSPCVFMEEAWRVPERFVARRPNPASPGWQVLVKWSRLGYDSASWEVRCSGHNLAKFVQHQRMEIGSLTTLSAERQLATCVCRRLLHPSQAMALSSM